MASLWSGIGGGAPAPAAPSSGTPPVLPKATTPPPIPYTSPGQQDAGQTFSQIGQGAIDWTNYAGGQMGASSSAADLAYSQYMNKNPSANLGSWSPGSLNSYSPASLQTWLKNANLGPLKLGGYQSATASTASTDTSNLTGFDPTGAMTTFATGAEQTFSKNLKEQLRQLTNKSVGAGRIDTGVFDEDQGRVINQNAADFSSALASQAAVLSGQKLSALTSADTIQSQLAQENAQLATGASEANAANSVTARGQDVAAYSADTARMGLGEDAASKMDTLGLERATSLDTLGLNRAGQMDTLGLNRDTTALDFALSRANNAATNYATAESAASGFASANLAHQDQQKLESDLIGWMTKMGIGPYGQPANATGSPAGSTTTGDPYAYWVQLANSLGVPFQRPPGG